MTCQHNRLCPVILRLHDRAADWFHRVFKMEAADKFRAKPNGIPGVVTPIMAILIPSISFKI